METGRSRLGWNIASTYSSLRLFGLVCLVATLSYFAGRLAGELALGPPMIWPFWPGCALLVSVLLLVPARIWPLLMGVAFAAFVFYDLQTGVPIGSIVWFIPADTVEVLIAAFCLRYFFNGIPRLNSLKALAKYSLIAVLLAPFAGTFLGAFGIHGDYWTSWSICFLSEVLAFVTLTPAILCWANEGPGWAKKPGAYYLEGAALISLLAFLGYISLAAPGRSGSPALLYSLVPLLLWSALRFGSMGASTSVIVVTLLSIWGAVHGRGPFTESNPIHKVLSLQLFVFFTAIPFMVLAALVEERKRAEKTLLDGDERFCLATQAGKMFAYEWDANSDLLVRSTGSAQIIGIDEAAPTTGKEIFARIHSYDQNRVLAAIGELSPEKPWLEISYRMVRPDGAVIWVQRSSRAQFDEQGKMLRMIGMMVDITERRNAEESLHLFRKLIDQSNDAIEVFDPKTLRLIDVNEKGCRELGYTREELLSLRVFDIDPTLSETSHAKARKDLDETGFALFESIHRRKDGSTFPVEVNAKRVELDRTYYVTVVRDITERKRAEQALRESEERLRLAVKAGKMYAFEWDKATDLIMRSGQGGDILDWISGSTIHTGRQFVARVYPADREEYAASETGLTAENPSYQINYRMLRPDGSVIWLEESGHAFFDAQGEMLKTIGIVADVTERKVAEEALRESEQRFGLVANSAPVMIWMSAVDKSYSFFNAIWLNFTGRSMEQELGEGWVSGVHPDDQERCLGIYSTAFDAHVDFEIEYRLRRFDGEYRWIVDLGIPRFGADGSFCGYIGSCVDITDRKLSETYLLELSGRLIHAQEEERTRIGRELHDDLGQRVALLQIGLDQFGQDESSLSPHARQQLSNIADVAAEVSSNIHDLSHLLHPSKLDTLGLVPSLRALCKELSNRHSLEVQFVHHGVLEGVSRDVSLCLFRIAQEALRNVVRHSGSAEAQVELTANADIIDLCIFDAGTGFNPEAVKGGPGLGLVSMRERLRLVGGQLSIESKPAQGTRIRVRVPLSRTNGQGKVEEKHYKANA